MKHLILMRHAKSSWSDPGIRDFDRPLNQRGLADAALMGSKITTQPDLVICSSAKRTSQTAEIVLDTMGASVETIEYTRALYMASCHQLMQCIGCVSNTHSCVMLVAHNPGVAEFAETYSNIRPTGVPTCSVFEFGYEVADWGELEHTHPHTQTFQFPRMYQQ